MPITSISRDQPNNVSIVRIQATDTLAQIATANYILNQTPVINELNKGVWRWFNSDVLLFDSADGNAFFTFTDDTFTSLVLLASSTDGTVSPGLMDQIAYYALSGTVVSGTNTLPAAVSIDPANANGGVGATANTFWAGNNTWKTVSAATNHSIYPVYVSPDGSDITGNGSINAPYQSIQFAINSVTTASSSALFQIICSYGLYNETTLTLKPWVSVEGRGSTLNVTGNIVQHASWSSGGEISFGNFNTVNISGNVNLDFSSAIALPCFVRIVDMNILTISGFSVIGADALTLILAGVSSSTSMLNLTIENASGAISQCFFANLTYTASSFVSSYNFQLLNSLSLGAVSFTSNVGAIGISSIIDNTKIFGTLSATGTNAFLNIDVASLTNSSLPVLSGGANAGFFNVSNTLSANYSPVNYIPDASGGTSPVISVAAHLHGIDNALGTVIGVESQTRYVSVLGSDITGDGSIDAPYQTVAFAVASITTASATNVFNVMLLDGVYTEAVQILLKPWVNLVGQSRNTTINNASNIILDSSWNTAVNGTISIENLNIQNDIDFDFTTVPTADGPIVYINNIQTDNMLIDGNTVNPCIFFIRNSFLVNPSFNNATVVSFSNYYFTGFNSGTTAFTSAMNYFSNNDYYQSTVSLTGAAVGPTQQFFNIKNSTLNFTLTVTGAQATLNIDTDSYITPTLVGGAVLNLTSVSGGLGADYVPVNYTPTAVAPTLSTSVQGHLRGIDNAIGAKTLTWSEVTGTSQAAAVNNAYITNNAGLVTVTLPATMAIGDRVAINGKGAGGWSLVANAGQIINVGNTPTSVAGSASSTNQWDAIEVICVTANTTWATRSMIGSLNVV